MKKILFLCLICLSICGAASAKTNINVTVNTSLNIDGIDVLLPASIGESTSFIQYGTATTLNNFFVKDKCYKVSTVQVGTGVVTDANGNVTNTFPIYESTVTEIPCP